MTRKRFIKLCMSHGWQRNDAQLLASRVGPAGSYYRLLRVFYFIRTIEEAGAIIADQICTFSDEVREILEKEVKYHG